MNLEALSLLFIGCIVGLIRNEIVYRCRMKALDTTHFLSGIAIDNGQPWENHYKKFDSYGSYGEMMKDLTKWRYRDFYAGLNETEENGEAKNI